MVTWEYKVLQLPGSDAALDEELLNVHGSKGWELQGFTTGAGGQRLCYLKRQRPEGAESDTTLSMKAMTTLPG